ncbi:heme-binding protein [soil metagenome]
MSSLTLQQANQIIAGALVRSKEQKFAPMAVVVLDAAGHIKAAQREDGASMFRVDVALGKAWGSVAMGANSGQLAARAKDNPNFFVTLAATAQGKFLPQPGAVLIKDADGTIIGAAGASGGTGEQDEAICIAGVQSAGLVNG